MLDKTLFEQVELSVDAQIVYTAFCEMSISKENYFKLLHNIEDKKREGKQPSIGEPIELQKLMAVHDDRVAKFSQAMKKISDQQDRQKLLHLMGQPKE